MIPICDIYFKISTKPYILTELHQLTAGEQLHITGYGKTAQTIFNHNTKLNFGTVYLWDMKECKEALSLFVPRQIRETNYCAGQKRNNGGQWAGSCTTKV